MEHQVCISDIYVLSLEGNENCRKPAKSWISRVVRHPQRTLHNVNCRSCCSGDESPLKNRISSHQSRHGQSENLLGYPQWIWKVSEAKIYLLQLQVCEISVTNTCASTNLWFIYSEGFFFFFFFSTFFNVDPIAVTYNLNPSTEQHLPSIGKYKVWHRRVRKCQGFVSGKTLRASLTQRRSRLGRSALLPAGSSAKFSYSAPTDKTTSKNTIELNKNTHTPPIRLLHRRPLSCHYTFDRRNIFKSSSVVVPCWDLCSSLAYVWGLLNYLI